MQNCGKRLLFSYLLNLFDLVATLLLIFRYGLDIEVNPFGRILLAQPVIAVIYKVVIIGLCLFTLYIFRYNKIAVISSYLILGVYALLGVYHIYIMTYI